MVADIKQRPFDAAIGARGTHRAWFKKPVIVSDSNKRDEISMLCVI